MGITKIEWTASILPDGTVVNGYSFNPWIGCAKVAPGCEHCYAEADMDKRRGRVKWGVNGTRSVTSGAYWKQPAKWNREAAAAGERRRVFCASLADVFEDREELTLWRSGLFDVIDETPNLDWLLLTKRPENIQRMWPQIPRNKEPLYVGNIDQPPWRHNVWLGTSISDQATADKAIPELLRCRDLSPVLFVSAEPLLGPIDFTRIRYECGGDCVHNMNCLSGYGGWDRPRWECKVDWVIVGGESGSNARPCDLAWMQSIRDQCKAAGVACFIKQLGANVVTRNDMIEDVFNSSRTGWPDPEVEHDIHGFREDYQGADCRIRLRDNKGGDPTEWPADLRVREFPRVTVNR